MGMQGLVLATDGFEDSELSYPYYRFQESGWNVDLATPDGESIVGEYGYEFDADLAIDRRDQGDVPLVFRSVERRRQRPGIESVLFWPGRPMIEYGFV